MDALTLYLNEDQALQLKRLLAQALATSDVGATLVDRLGFEAIGVLTQVATDAGWNEEEMQAQADADQE